MAGVILWARFVSHRSNLIYFSLLETHVSRFHGGFIAVSWPVSYFGLVLSATGVCFLFLCCSLIFIVFVIFFFTFLYYSLIFFTFL